MTNATNAHSHARHRLGLSTLAGAAALAVAGLALPHSVSAQVEDVFADPAPSSDQTTDAQADQQANQQGAPPQAQQQISIGDFLRAADGQPAPIRLGLRAHSLREAQQVADVVIVVSNATDAARVIGAWAGLTRFPVLIDDGSALAAENIARFNRAFKPSAVLRWQPTDSTPWPDDPPAAAQRFISVLGSTLDKSGDLKTMADVLATMRRIGIGPNGAVAVDPTDKAWIAGLALAAGRSQVAVFVQPDGGVNGLMSGNDMRALAGTIQQQLEAVGVGWENMADEIDSVTLVGNHPLRVGLGLDGKDEKALTDLIGRHRGGIGNRWAWAGAVFGDEQTALYRAMCGLFLPSDTAWLFDGYGRGDPWDLYDATSAGRVFEKGKFTVEVHDTPANRVRDWRKAAQRGIDADIVLINSMGGVGYFKVGDANAYPGDIPLLESPAVVHIVHSWSSRVPASNRSVAGRWLEHGAYAFYGSIDEPFLNAFVQTPQVAGRLLAGLPWGVAVRQPTGAPWKLNVLGDPLVTFIPGATAGNRLSGTPRFHDARDFNEIVTEHLKAERFGDAIRALTVAGRDNAAARLSSALLSDKPEKVDNATAATMILPLYRAGRFNALADAYNRIDPDRQNTPILQDALWHAARTTLAAGPSTLFEGLIRRNLREGQEEHDAVEIAGYIASRVGPREAVAYLEGISPIIDNDNRRKTVTDAIRRMGGPTRP